MKQRSITSFFGNPSTKKEPADKDKADSGEIHNGEAMNALKADAQAAPPSGSSCENEGNSTEPEQADQPKRKPASEDGKKPAEGTNGPAVPNVSSPFREPEVESEVVGKVPAKKDMQDEDSAEDAAPKRRRITRRRAVAEEDNDSEEPVPPPPRAASSPVPSGPKRSRKASPTRKTSEELVPAPPRAASPPGPSSPKRARKASPIRKNSKQSAKASEGQPEDATSDSEATGDGRRSDDGPVESGKAKKTSGAGANFFAPKKKQTAEEVTSASVAAEPKPDAGDKLAPILSADYSKYDAESSALWRSGEPMPYLWLAKTFEAIEGVSGRLDKTRILANSFRTVLAISPKEILQCLYLSTNKLAPPHEGIELGIGDAILRKALAEATGRTAQHLKESMELTGDLGDIAQASRSNQRTMFASKPLTVSGVFASLKAIAQESGKDSMKKKVDKIKALLVAARDCEPKYIMRSLQGKLRIGCSDQTVMVALAQAIIYNPPALQSAPEKKSRKVKPSDELTQKVEDAVSTLKAVYSEVPSWDTIVGVLLETGGDMAELRRRCELMPGIPVSPMLAKPTKGLSEVLDRFEGTSFTCEFKYDGERAQIHWMPDGKVEIFSRNAEHTTTKFPDLVEVVKRAIKPGITSFVIDCEAVAFDRPSNKILPFQTLSTRARKGATLDNIQVSVCVFAFDLLFLNGKSYLREPLRSRREALFDSFSEVDGEFSFARHVEATSTEDMQTFLDEAVSAGCEGLMVKTLDSNATYEPSRRSLNWLKVKKDYIEGMTDSLDLVPIGAWFGKGKRTGWYGAFLLACYDEENEEFQSICKIGTGFSDAALESLWKQLKEKEIKQPPHYYRYADVPKETPEVWFDSAFVWEVKAADLSISPVHKAALGTVDPTKGIALRFPRFIRIRDDKNPEQATNASQVVDMYRSQKTISKPSGGAEEDEDDY